MAHNCIVVNLDRCTGCYSCEITCKMENDIALGEHWNKMLQRGPFGDYPNMTRYPHHVPAVRRRPVRARVPHRRQLPRRQQRGAHRPREVHRLQVLHDGLPVRRAFMEPVGTRGGEVHALRPTDQRGRRAQVRGGVLCVGSLLRRSGRSEFGRLQSACRRRRRLGSSPEGRGQRPSDGLHPVSQVR